MKSRILVVDDEVNICNFYEDYLTKQDYQVFTANNWKKAEKIIFSNPLDVILLDLQLPGKNGIEILKEIKKKFQLLEVIIFSGQANIQVAVEAIKEGAFDFIQKSDSIEKILTVIENGVRFKQLKEENLILKKIKKLPEKDFIGKSPVIQKIKREIMIAAKSDANVLITGENGTGKQIIAENIHFFSGSEGNFVDINCAAIPENLLESELFGYEKGAFTGAYSTNKGKFELAEHGSLFLDEIGEMPAPLQAKLLKALESRIYRRLGSVESLNLSARIIAATNIDIEKEIKENNFRKDLFYRLNVIHIHLPPLRERLEDIPLLIETFLKQLGKAEKKFSLDAVQYLSQYSWPGNIRELRNIVERSVIMNGNQKLIEKEDIKDYLQVNQSLDMIDAEDDLDNSELSLKEFLEKKEKNYIKSILKKTKTQKEAASLLKIERTVLYRKIKKHNIKI